MLNTKIIVINGFARGGTNILWNLFQSHPNVCSPLGETGQVLYGRFPRPIPTLARFLLTCRLTLRTQPLLGLTRHLIDKRLYNLKLQNIDHPDNKYKNEHELYTLDEIAGTTLCTKSVNNDCYLTDYFVAAFPDVKVVNLVRNGYALCEGWVRRGASAKAAGRYYRKLCEYMLELATQNPNTKIERFEDIVAAPFDKAEALFRFAELTPSTLPTLRLKAKRIVRDNNSHETKFGTENRKYWVSPQTVHEFLDPKISSRQRDLLSSSDRKEFEGETLPILEYFGYAAPH